jgi:hypothetical protein
MIAYTTPNEVTNDWKTRGRDQKASKHKLAIALIAVLMATTSCCETPSLNETCTCEMAYVKVQTFEDLPISDSPDLVIWIDKLSLQVHQESNRSVTRWEAVKPGVYSLPNVLQGERIIFWLDRPGGLELLEACEGLWRRDQSVHFTIDEADVLAAARIEDLSGVPLSGVTVQLTLWATGSPIGVTTTTGEDGMFAFEHLKYGEWGIQVDDPRFAPVRTMIILKPSQPIEDLDSVEVVRLEPFMEQIVEFQWSDGQPVPEVLFDYRWRNSKNKSSGAFQTISNAAGRAVLRVPVNSEVSLNAQYGLLEAPLTPFYASDKPLVIVGSK